MANIKKTINTRLIHGPVDGDKHTGAVNVPIYQTSTYSQISPGKHKGYEYSRTGNPTREALEKLIADLESGYAGFGFASGLAAITAVLSLFKSCDKIIISNNVYGGTFRVLNTVFKNFGIGHELVDTSKPEEVEAAITDGVKAIYIETPTNPLLNITDIKAISEIAKAHNLYTIVDNTFYTPYLQRPIEYGADIVIHSATKYLGGHSDLIAGLVVVNNKEIASKIAFIQNSMGGVLQPFDSFLLIRGIKTLGVRMDRHVSNAEILAEALRNNSEVKKIYYPGFKEHPGHDINFKQAKNGGAIISFELTENHNVDRFFEGLKHFILAESLGGVESLVCHPASMTHAAIPREIRDSVGITDSLIRLSVGIEDVKELQDDLEQAIAASRRYGR
ncbi:trans-sulfuration enzyme family protein [Anaerosacchariphilus polymeriproducens]|uniref:Aminotransferase class I/II-fold pyridoxal phosphate-dependent enzyme n=1 Tax=Anaerosacchariphilus polymeriproducens TaxID=1812858 RepID=A0A371AZA3_9FIRM|nr:PLP-dependent transferase [Anaerosacchariphilus polymeriproducens]RDU24924.1 aminotransferase class I/II-fold pyridoxal phosphate-dependent enzyme [Anaerosacchariphilus polymeriproducens]